MVEVVSIKMSEDKRTMLETIKHYEDMAIAMESQLEALKFGLGVLRKTVKEGLE